MSAVRALVPADKVDLRFPRTVIETGHLPEYFPGITPERLEEAKEVTESFSFRVPDFYLRRVLTQGATDPLLDLVVPSGDELLDGDEQWDATPSSYRASESSFWVQKYEYQGLVRTTTHCSGICRFCYLKQKNEQKVMMRPEDARVLFRDLEKNGRGLREIILSGGDPLCASPETLHVIAQGLRTLREVSGSALPHVVIHTREPVWDPERLLRRENLWKALDDLKPTAIMIHVMHPREVTSEFLEVCSRFGEIGGGHHQPVLLCQHPVFRGVNNSADILENLYDLLSTASPPVLPYYFVHPFYNGTLKRHKLSLEESLGIFQQLVRRPGWLTPRLVVPTPWGKCLIGPYEQLKRNAGGYELTTKDGLKVLYHSDQSQMRRL